MDAIDRIELEEDGRIFHDTEVDIGNKCPVTTLLHLVQYDNTLPIIAVKLYQNGNPFSLVSTATASIRWKNPNGTVPFRAKEVLGRSDLDNQTTLYIEVDPNMTYCFGESYAILEISVAGNTVGTSKIDFVIHKNPVQNEDIEREAEALGLAEVAYSGSYNDLSDKPVIPVALKPRIVEELPEVGEEGILYLVLTDNPKLKNIYDEFIWISDQNKYEQIGSTKMDLTNYVDKTTNYEEIPSIKYFTKGIEIRDKRDSTIIPHLTFHRPNTYITEFYNDKIVIGSNTTFNFPTKQSGTYTFAMVSDIENILLGEKYVINKTTGDAEFTGTLRGGNIIATTGNIESAQGMLGGVRVDTRNIDGCGAFHFYDYDAEACLDPYNYSKDPENYKHGLYFIGNFTGKELGINQNEQDCWSLIQYTDFTDLSYVELENAHLRPYQIAIKAETGERYERFGTIIEFSHRTTGSWGNWVKAANSKLLNNTIAGEGGFSSGTSSEANGQYSIACGGWNLANGFCSAAFGQETWALNSRELVCGVCNDTSDTDVLFCVGNGEPGVGRSNAFTVHSDGHAELQTQGNTDNSVTTKGYVDNSKVKYVHIIQGSTIQGGSISFQVINDDSTSKNITLAKLLSWINGKIVIASGQFIGDDGEEYYATIAYVVSKKPLLTIVIEGGGGEGTFDTNTFTHSVYQC